METKVLVQIILLLPLFGAAINGMMGLFWPEWRTKEKLIGGLAFLAVAIPFGATATLFFGFQVNPDLAEGTLPGEVVRYFTWLKAGDLHVDFAYRVDQLSLLMTMIVTGIGSLIHLYSIGYMHGDPKFSKFFLYLNLFVLSMTLLVLGSNLLVTFLGWEGVGTCSYLLISFWHTKDANATAGKKAFVTNRVGDFGVMLAMFLAFGAVGSVDYAVLNESALAGTLTEATATGIAGLLFLGAVGKSAQLPLFVWLPDAMAGPTPVSALIHAATMVTAGVFLMVRVNPVLGVAADWIPTLIAWIGALTALFAATIALAQNDIKKVLAYSTVSQLGYMFLAVGTGAYVAAIFHMVTHAFFKALLFLGSGSVIHGMHEEQDMRKMGGLLKVMPITAGTFIIGWLAIAGVPPFAGFWSKDEVLLYAAAESWVLYAIGVVTAIITAFYMTRQVVMTFFGTPRWGEDPDAEAVAAPEGDDGESESADADAEDADAAADDAELVGAGASPKSVGAAAAADAHETMESDHHEFTPHESPPTMTIPLVVLAFLSVFGGAINLPTLGIIPKDWQHKLLDWLHPVVEFGEEAEARGIGEAVIKGTTASDNKVLLIYVAIACALIGIAAAWAVYQQKRAKPYEPEILANGWGYDAAISWFMGRPGRQAFQATADFDKDVVDGAVNGTATVVRETAGQIRKGQTGYVRQYAGVIGVGVVLLMAWFVVVRGLL
ncbi:MAG: NADH-quinone oxidoreductase subunit L [Actinomycetota bacterium]